MRREGDDELTLRFPKAGGSLQKIGQRSARQERRAVAKRAAIAAHVRREPIKLHMQTRAARIEGGTRHTWCTRTLVGK